MSQLFINVPETKQSRPTKTKEKRVDIILNT